MALDDRGAGARGARRAPARAARGDPSSRTSTARPTARSPSCMGIPEGTAKSRLRLALRAWRARSNRRICASGHDRGTGADDATTELASCWPPTRCTRPCRARPSGSSASSRPNPRAAAEFARLSTAAAWIGATEALTPPPALRRSVLAAARARTRTPRPTTTLDAALPRPRPTGSTRSSATLAPGRPRRPTTANGLSVRDLLIHLAAMETMVSAGARDAGRPSSPRPARTSRVAPRRSSRRSRCGRSTTSRRLWRDGGRRRCWSGPRPAPRAAPAVARHGRPARHPADQPRVRDVDPRRRHPARARPAAGAAAAGRTSTRMADFSMRQPPDLARASPGAPTRAGSARVVLTGAGGGSWLVPLGPATARRSSRPSTSSIEVDVVDWCHRVGERVDDRRDRGAGRLATRRSPRDMLESASALATL